MMRRGNQEEEERAHPARSRDIHRQMTLFWTFIQAVFMSPCTYILLLHSGLLNVNDRLTLHFNCLSCIRPNSRGGNLMAIPLPLVRYPEWSIFFPKGDVLIRLEHSRDPSQPFGSICLGW